MTSYVGSFDHYDLNKDGSLDMSEVAKAMEEVYEKAVDAGAMVRPPVWGGQTVDFDEMAKRFFDSFDVDASGTISRAEWIVFQAAKDAACYASPFYTGMELPLKHAQPIAPSPIAYGAYPYPVDTDYPVFPYTGGGMDSLGRFNSSSFVVPAPAPAPRAKRTATKKKKKMGICGPSACKCITYTSVCAGIGAALIMTKGRAFYNRQSDWTKGVLSGLFIWPAAFSTFVAFP